MERAKGTRADSRLPVLPSGFLGLLLVLSCASTGETPEAALESTGADAIQGGWTLLRSQTHLPDGTVRAGSPQESFLLFSEPYYSMNTAGGREPSPSYESRFQPTDEEKLDRYNRLLVNAGRYSAADGRLTIHPTIALVPEFVGGLGEFEYDLAGDTLRLIWRVIRSADGVSDPRTAEGWSYHYTWVRMP